MSTRRRRRRRLNIGGFIIGLVILAGVYWAAKSGALVSAMTVFGEVVGGWVSSLLVHGTR